jgi:TPR repeat protein
LANMFGEQYNKEILQVGAKYATTNRANDREQLFQILDLIWEKSLCEKVDNSLCDTLKQYDPLLAQNGLSVRDIFYKQGLLLLSGQGTPKNCEEAVQWFKRSERLGDSCAAYLLGCCYEEGNGCETNLVEAIKYYREAANSGCVDSQFALGRCLMSSNVEIGNAVEAFAWLKFAAKNGQTQAFDLSNKLQLHLTESELKLGCTRFDELCSSQTTNNFNCWKH